MSPLPTFKKGDEVVLRKDRRTNNEGVDRLGRIVGYYFIVKDVAQDPPSVKLDLRAAADEWFDARVFEHHNVAKRFKTGDLVIGDPDCQPKEAASMADWCHEVHAVSHVHPDEPWIELYGREGYWYFASHWKIYEPVKAAGGGIVPPADGSISTQEVAMNTISAATVLGNRVVASSCKGKRIWVSYFHDPMAIVSGIFETEVDALRYANENDQNVAEISLGPIGDQIQ